MKKHYILIFALCAVLALAGCGNSGTETENATSTTEEVSVEEETPAWSGTDEEIEAVVVQKLAEEIQERYIGEYSNVSLEKTRFSIGSVEKTMHEGRAHYQVWGHFYLYDRYGDMTTGGGVMSMEKDFYMQIADSGLVVSCSIDEYTDR